MDGTQQHLNILSLNVYHGQMPQELLAYAMSKLEDVSVFCFQETDEGAPKLLDSVLLDGFTSYNTSKVVGGELFSITTYVRRDLEVVNTQTIHVDTPDTGLALRCLIVGTNGRKIAVTNVYGAPRPGHKLDTPERISLSQALVDMTHNPEVTEIIAGDFNLMPETESVKMFAASGYRDLINEFEIPTTRNEIVWQKFPAHMKQLYADYAFVRGDGIDCDLAVEDVLVSDHLPMLVSVRQKPSIPQRFGVRKRLKKLARLYSYR